MNDVKHMKCVQKLLSNMILCVRRAQADRKHLTGMPVEPRTFQIRDER